MNKLKEFKTKLKLLAKITVLAYSDCEYEKLMERVERLTLKMLPNVKELGEYKIYADEKRQEYFSLQHILFNF